MRFKIATITIITMYLWGFFNFLADTSFGEAVYSSIFIYPLLYISYAVLGIDKFIEKRKGRRFALNTPLYVFFYSNVAWGATIYFMVSGTIISSGRLGESGLIYIATIGAPFIYAIPGMIVAVIVGKIIDYFFFSQSEQTVEQTDQPKPKKKLTGRKKVGIVVSFFSIIYLIVLLGPDMDRLHRRDKESKTLEAIASVQNATQEASAVLMGKGKTVLNAPVTATQPRRIKELPELDIELPIGATYKIRNDRLTGEPASVSFYPADDIVINGITFTRDVRIRANGNLTFGYLAFDQEIDGIKFKGSRWTGPLGGGTMGVFFNEDGDVANAILAEPQEINGLTYKHQIQFHKNYQVETGRLAEPGTLDGVDLPADTYIHFNYDGTVQSAQILSGTDTYLIKNKAKYNHKKDNPGKARLERFNYHKGIKDASAYMKETGNDCDMRVKRMPEGVLGKTNGRDVSKETGFKNMYRGNHEFMKSIVINGYKQEIDTGFQLSSQCLKQAGYEVGEINKSNPLDFVTLNGRNRDYQGKKLNQARFEKDIIYYEFADMKKYDLLAIANDRTWISGYKIQVALKDLVGKEPSEETFDITFKRFEEIYNFYKNIVDEDIHPAFRDNMMRELHNVDKISTMGLNMLAEKLGKPQKTTYFMLTTEEAVALINKMTLKK